MLTFELYSGRKYLGNLEASNAAEAIALAWKLFGEGDRAELKW